VILHESQISMSIGLIQLRGLGIDNWIQVQPNFTGLLWLDSAPNLLFWLLRYIFFRCSSTQIHKLLGTQTQ
ncbi:Hypothetical predicted protein, partial [Olea europaea subsp. europaea]